MAENKPIINIIFDSLNHRIKNIGEKCLNFQEQNKNLKEQLVRKTQECENWKETAEQYAKNEEYYRSQVEQLKAENEKLKANNETWKTFDVTFDNGIVKFQISDLSLAEYSQLELEKEQAEHKLERIREIATALCYTVMSDGVVTLQKDILQIIDEVKNV